MIRHILLFSFRPDADESERESVLEGLREFPQWFPRMRSFELGRNESRRDTAYEYGMTLVFDNFDDLHSYLDSNRHEHFVNGRFRPTISKRTIVSFET